MYCLRQAVVESTQGRERLIQRADNAEIELKKLLKIKEEVLLSHLILNTHIFVVCERYATLARNRTNNGRTRSSRNKARSMAATALEFEAKLAAREQSWTCGRAVLAAVAHASHSQRF